jgi:hypothetical protein
LPDDQLLVAGYTFNYGNPIQFGYVLKTDSQGERIFEHYLFPKTGGCVLYDMRLTNDGGAIAVGKSLSDLYLTKIDHTGNSKWQARYRPGGGYGRGSTVAQTLDGGYIAAGHMFDRDIDIYLVKTDENGLVAGRGDVDENLRLDLTDAIKILNWLFRGGAPPRCPALADVDRDGRASITDAIYLLNFLFTGGPAPSSDPADCLPPL